MTTPIEREHNTWSLRYLGALLRRDENELICLLADVLADVKPSEYWDLLDSLGATARDTILAVASADTTCDVLSARLVQNALTESSTE